MTVLENMGRVRKANKLSKQMGLTLRRSVPDPANPMQNRYETVASVGFDSKTARIASGGSMYQMRDSPAKAIVTSAALLGGAGVAGMYAYKNVTGNDKDMVTAIVSSLLSLSILAAIAPYDLTV